MKEKWKNLSIALIIAAIVTVIFATCFYYIGCRNISEIMNGFEGIESATGITSTLGKSFEKQQYQDLLFGTIVGSIFLFCIATLFSYIVIERLRKRKK